MSHADGVAPDQPTHGMENSSSLNYKRTSRYAVRLRGLYVKSFACDSERVNYRVKENKEKMQHKSTGSFQYVNLIFSSKENDSM